MLPRSLFIRLSSLKRVKAHWKRIKNSLEHSNLNWINTYLGNLSLKPLMSTCALPRALLTWSLFCAEGPTTPQPNLGLFHHVSPLSYEVLLARGLTFWVPTHAPQSLVTCPGVDLPFPRTMHMVLPWLWPFHGSYLFQGLPAVAWVLHESGYPLLVLDLWPWSHPSLHLTSVLYGRDSKPLGRCLYSAMSLFRRCLFWAIPLLGDASARHWLERLTCWLLFLGTLEGPPPCIDSDLWSMPNDRMIQKQPIIFLVLC